ncbi:MAG: hypothetical protein SGILL_006405, partial [Bacillariaceae sp.]
MDDDTNTDLEWVIYHLTMNDDEDFTYVELDVDLCRSDNDQWRRLLIGLARNSTLETLDLTRGLQRMVATDEDLERLFEAIRLIPELRKVKLDSFSTDDLLQSRSLFQNNEKITALVIENTRFVPEDAETQNQNRFDERHVDFLLSMCERSLRILRIEIPQPLLSADPVHVPFAPLLQESSDLKELVIEASGSICFIKDDHFATLIEAVKANSKLIILDIDLQVSPEGFDLVTTMLEKNQTLQELRLN